MYKAEEIAAYVIKTTKWMSNFKLQSVLYFVQAEFLVVKGRPCFGDPIEAWDFGPVIPNVYRQYAIYGGMMILEAKAPMPHLTKEDRELIDGIIKECEKYDTTELIGITTKQTPWKNAYRNFGRRNTLLSTDIYEFFK